MKATSQVKGAVNIKLSPSAFSTPFSLKSQNHPCSCNHTLFVSDSQNPQKTLKLHFKKTHFITTHHCPHISCNNEYSCTYVPCNHPCLPVGDLSFLIDLDLPPQLVQSPESSSPNQKAKCDTSAAQGKHSFKPMWVLLPSNQDVHYI